MNGNGNGNHVEAPAPALAPEMPAPAPAKQSFVLPCEIRFSADGEVEAVSCDLAFIREALKAGMPLAEVANHAQGHVEIVGPAVPSLTEIRVEP